MSSAGFTPDSLLRVADAVIIKLQSQQARVSSGGVEQTFTPQALEVLSAFVYPRRVAEVLTEWKGRLASMQAWMNLTQTLAGLVRMGALVQATTTPSLSARSAGFDAAPIHTQMLNDSARTEAYLAAIRATVKPGDTVVDLGTGTGILATAAALAGASHVYAIEASGIADLAQRMFEINGVADRVTLVRGWSTDIQLPTRGSVLVSEIVGHDPFDEQILEATRDARKRLLTPDARLIPERLRLGLRLLSIPDAAFDEYFFTRDNIARWSNAYGLDFAALSNVESSDTERFMVKRSQALAWSLLTDSTSLASIELRSHDSVQSDVSVDVPCPAGGKVNAVLVFPELELIDGISVSTDPAKAAETCSWHPYAYRLPNPIQIAVGGAARVRYRYRSSGKTLEVSAL